MHLKAVLAAFFGSKNLPWSALCPRVYTAPANRSTRRRIIASRAALGDCRGLIREKAARRRVRSTTPHLTIESDRSGSNG
jgi:hypothetical protein